MENKQFEIKEEHLKLLRRMYVGWDDCEFGAPEIDPKRPYGNSDVEQDMIEILGLKEIRNGVFEFELFGKKYMLKGEDKNSIWLDGAEEQELSEELNCLHKETETVLQIVLVTGKFETGKYVASSYGIDWKKENDGSTTGV